MTETVLLSGKVFRPLRDLFLDCPHSSKNDRNVFREACALISFKSEKK